MTVHIVVRQEMPASAERTFDLIHDYARRLSWDTMLRSAYIDGGGPPGKGAVAVCVARRMLGGYSFRTRYVTFHRPQVAAIKLEGRPPFFASWAASIRHEPLGPERSLATYTMTFTCKPSWAARVIEPAARWVSAGRPPADLPHCPRPSNARYRPPDRLVGSAGGPGGRGQRVRHRRRGQGRAVGGVAGFEAPAVGQ